MYWIKVSFRLSSQIYLFKHLIIYAQLDFSRHHFYNEFFDNSRPQFEIIQEIENYAKKYGADVIQNKAKWFVHDLSRYWNKCKRNKIAFESKYSDWLSKDLYSKSIPKTSCASSSKVTKKFEDLSISQKRRRTAGERIPMLL